jgi:hypothetical protein
MIAFSQAGLRESSAGSYVVGDIAAAMFKYIPGDMLASGDGHH